MMLAVIGAIAAITVGCIWVACYGIEDEPGPLPRWVRWFIVGVVIGLAIFAASRALARNNGQYADVPKPIADWVKTLKTPLTPQSTCCDIADGNRDILWDTEGEAAGKQYRVSVAGKWIPVPPEAVITEPNRLGYPVVWMTPNGSVKCFLPGAGG